MLLDWAGPSELPHSQSFKALFSLTTSKATLLTQAEVLTAIPEESCLQLRLPVFKPPILQYSLYLSMPINPNQSVSTHSRTTHSAQKRISLKKTPLFSHVSSVSKNTTTNMACDAPVKAFLSATSTTIHIY